MRNIWLIGTGAMAIEYAKVLQALDVNFITVGRGEKNAQAFENATNAHALRGGLAEFLESRPEVPFGAIVAVGVEVLAEATLQLINFGVTNILLEKPGVAQPSEIGNLVRTADSKKANVVLAYNRRFYSSVLKAQEIIQADGGVTSFNFEFTEWSHVIKNLNKPKVTLENWFLANSTHVADTAFFLGGIPSRLSAYYKGGTSWHPGGSIYSGAGESKTGALFSYQANWEAPGRWVIEILTAKNRLYFKPMESLQIQEIGSVAVNPVEIDDQLDKDFKPGFYLQTKAFLEEEFGRFCSLSDQQHHLNNHYLAMSGYK